MQYMIRSHAVFEQAPRVVYVVETLLDGNIM